MRPLVDRLCVALALGSGLAALDAAAGVLAWGRGQSLVPFLLPLVATSLALGAGIAIVWAILARLVRTEPRVPLLASAGAAASAWLAVLVQTETRGWVDPARAGVAVGLGLVLGGLLAWGGFHRGRRADPARDGDRAGTGLAAAAAWAGLGVLWIAHRARAGSPGALFAVTSAFALLLLVAAALRWPRAARWSVRAVPPALGLAAALGSAGWVSAPKLAELPRAASGLLPRPGAPRRIVLIVVDTLRADALSCLAPGAPPTPGIDELAGQSLIFRQARSAAPWTLPAMASILTGTEPSVHGTTQPDRALPRQLPTLAEKLAASGYRTVAVGENSILRPAAGLSRGFEVYDWFPRFRPEPPLATWLMRQLGAPPARWHADAREVTDRALAWARAAAEEPLFLWVHYFDVHTPYEPPAAFRPEGTPPAGLERGFDRLRDLRLGHYAPDTAERAWIRSLYRAEVRWTDSEVARLLRGLREADLLDDALVVLTSDHGEELWEHESFEHGHSVHEELLRVPLLVKLPGGAPAGDVRGAVSTASLAPTLLAAAGADPFEAGTSAPALELAPGRVPERPIPSSGQLYYEPHAALLEGARKYVVSLATGEERAYDLERDPLELAPLPAERDLDELRAAFAACRARAAELRQRSATIGTGAERDLRALGYLGGE